MPAARRSTARPQLSARLGLSSCCSSSQKSEAERIAERKRRLTKIAECWNQLCGILRPWEESDGYDRVRWHPVTFLDTAAEAEYHHRVAEAGLRKAE